MRASMLMWSPVLFAVAINATAGSLQAMNDADLGDVTAREGVAIDFDFSLNANTNGTAIAAFNNCKNTNLCNIALQFNNRGDTWWTVYKDTYGSTLMRNLFLDGAFSPTSASGYANSSRFLNSAGTVCLPNPAVAVGVCATAIQDKPLIAFTYQSTDGFGPAVAYTTFENDVQTHLHVGRVAVEYGATGYSADLRGSFMGLRISDTQQLRARIDVDGRAFLTGF